MLTEEQFNAIQKYEQQFRSVKAGYLRMGNGDLFFILETVYGKEWRKTIPSSVSSCGNCKIREINKVSDMYFEYLNSHIETDDRETITIETDEERNKQSQ